MNEVDSVNLVIREFFEGVDKFPLYISSGPQPFFMYILKDRCNFNVKFNNVPDKFSATVTCTSPYTNSQGIKADLSETAEFDTPEELALWYHNKIMYLLQTENWDEYVKTK